MKLILKYQNPAGPIQVAQKSELITAPWTPKNTKDKYTQTDKSTNLQLLDIAITDKFPTGKIIPKSELNWNYKDWFSKRSDHSYSLKDVDAFQKHIPEYLEIERKAKADGTWLIMPNGLRWKGDPRSWVMMQSKDFKKNYQDKPWWTGLGSWLDTDGISYTTKSPRYNGRMWFSDNKWYGDTFAYHWDKSGLRPRKYTVGQENISGYNYLSAIPKKGNYRYLERPKQGTYDTWEYMPYDKVDNDIIRIDSIYNPIKNKKSNSKRNSYDNQKAGKKNLRQDNKKVKTDDVANWSEELGDDGIYMYNVYDGPVIPSRVILNDDVIINEFISLPGFTNKIKFIEGNNGNFDINDPYKYAFNKNDKKVYAKKGVKLIKRK